MNESQLAELERIRSWACCLEPERRFMIEVELNKERERTKEISALYEQSQAENDRLYNALAAAQIFAINLKAENEALRIKPAESLDDIVLLVEKAMQCIEATGEGLYTESFDGELTDAFNALDDALATLKPQLAQFSGGQDA